jgi:hypothetical protein
LGVAASAVNARIASVADCVTAGAMAGEAFSFDLRISPKAEGDFTRPRSR